MSEHPGREGDRGGRRGGRPGGVLPRAEDPARSVPEADRMTTLHHELRNLLDGSLRCLSLAARSLPAESAAASGTEVETARRQIETVSEALERMAGMLHHAMRREPGVPWFTGSGATLGEAVAHAAEVMRPLAGEHRVSILVDVSTEASALAAGAVYPAVLNAVRNAVESIVSCGGHGSIEVRAWVEAGESGRREVRIEVRDDGKGPPIGCETDPGWSASVPASPLSPSGHGIGLRVAGVVARELGGTFGLEGARGTRPGRTGAVFYLRYPMPEPKQNAAQEPEQ